MLVGVKIALFHMVAGGEFCPNLIFFQVDFLLKTPNYCLINYAVLRVKSP